MITLDELNSDFHSVAVKNGVNQLAIDGAGAIAAVVSATNLDIRDLVFATDKVDVSGSEVSLDSATLAALENITVSATNLDIRDLVFATDKVDVSGSTILTQMDAFDTWKATAQSITSTASQVAATSLASRLSITIENLGSKDIFIGASNAVTISTGIKISAGSSFSESLGAAATIWAITVTGTADIRIAEFAA